MKNKLIFFTLILLLVVPVSFVSSQHPQHSFKEKFGRSRILEMARLYSPSIRSANCYVVASKAPGSSSINVNFEFEGQFEITISNDETEFYNNVISINLPSNNRSEQLNISISDLKQGNYVFTIKDLSNQKSAFGKFTVM